MGKVINLPPIGEPPTLEEMVACHNKFLQHVDKQIEIGEENFQAIGEDIMRVKEFCLTIAWALFSHLKGKSLTDEQISFMAELLGCEWDGGIEDFLEDWKNGNFEHSNKKEG